jgi:thymidylate synthase (FAD)
MATGKRICQTDAPLVDIINETDKIASRVRTSVKTKHGGVLEHVMFTFLIEGVSRVETHQNVRHRMASYLQMSQRTVDSLDLDIIHPPTVLEAELPVEMWSDIEYLEELSRKIYKALQDYTDEEGNHPIPRGDARYYLLHNWETRIWMSINTRALMHFLNLRYLKKGAQWEIREVATQMYELVKDICPNAFAEDLQGYWE